MLIDMDGALIIKPENHMLASAVTSSTHFTQLVLVFFISSVAAAFVIGSTRGLIRRPPTT